MPFDKIEYIRFCARFAVGCILLSDTACGLSVHDPPEHFLRLVGHRLS